MKKNEKTAANEAAKENKKQMRVNTESVNTPDALARFQENTACEELQDLSNSDVMERRKAIQKRLWARLNELTREARRKIALPVSTNEKLREYYISKGIKVGDYMYYNELSELGLKPRSDAQPLLFWGKKNESGFFNVVQKFRKSDCEGVKVENL